MAPAYKLLLHFKAAPWEDLSAPPTPPIHSLITSGRPGGVVPEIWFKNLSPGALLSQRSATDPPGAHDGWLASGFATGSYATALAALGDEGATDLLLRQLARDLPGASLARLRSRLVASKSCDWTDRKWVGGGYSAPSFREAKGARALYRRPEGSGCLYFAGEASEDSCMTMSAALESGRRAAAELLSGWFGAPGGPHSHRSCL